MVLTDDITTKDDKGLLGLDKEQMSDVVLIPGLKVDVDGVSDNQGWVVAKTIAIEGGYLGTSRRSFWQRSVASAIPWPRL